MTWAVTVSIIFHLYNLLYTILPKLNNALINTGQMNVLSDLHKFCLARLDPEVLHFINNSGICIHVCKSETDFKILSFPSHCTREYKVVLWTSSLELPELRILYN